MTFTAPDIDYAGISPIIALTAGICVVLLSGVVSENRWVPTLLSLATLGAAAGLCIWQWGENQDLVAGALRLDDLGLAGSLIAIASAAFVVPMTLREPAAHRAGHADWLALLLSSVLGMVLLAMAQDLISLFIALELLSIPLYVLCGSQLSRRASLESGLKYLIVGSLGSATLLYGLAFIYGASGATEFTAIREGVEGVFDDPMLLVGIGLAATGLAFKVSLAPFHQWTPDVYQGAPTPVTAFMAVATKAAAFCVFVRFFYTALGPSVADWDGPLAVLAVVSILVGNVGALMQDSLKRMLGYSGIAQAGYMLVGIVVASELGVNALVFYLAAYTLMNLPAFAVILVRERETALGDNIDAIAGIGRDRPELAWPITISMLALAGLPGTAGFIGKLYLIEAAVDGDFTWLGVAIAVGTMVSLGYYLRVIAAVWMRPAAGPEAMPAMAGGSPEADAEGAPAVEAPPRAAPRRTRCPMILVPTWIAALATVVFGIVPSPLVDWATDAGESLTTLL